MKKYYALINFLRTLFEMLRFQINRLFCYKGCLFLFIIIYVVFFSYVTILRVHALQTYAYDLGNYNQALYTTLTGKGFLYYTADLSANPSGSLFGVHISGVLLLIMPIYALAPKVETLLIIQSLILALGALPVYLLAELKIKSKRLALAFAMAYLLNPALQGINWYDFHPEAFVILPMLFAMYFYEIRAWLFCSISLSFVLLAIDKATILVGAFGLFGLLSLKHNEVIRKRNPSSPPFVIKRGPEFRRFIIFTSMIILAFMWFFLSAELVSIFNPLNIYLRGNLQYWTNLGARNLTEIPVRAIFYPTSVLKALAFDWPQKAYYILVLFGSLLFLPIACPKTVILFLPWLATSLLSNYPPYYQFGTQYPAYIIPAIFYGGILGASKIISRIKNLFVFRPHEKRFPSLMLATGIFFLVLSSPLTPWSFGSYPLNYYGFPETPSEARYVTNFVKIIPENASILVQNNIFPLVSDRENAYVTPASVFYPPATSFLSTLESIVEKVDYILVDLRTGAIDACLLLSNPMVKQEFGLLAFAESVLLLKRDYSESPLIFKPFDATFNYRDLVPSERATLIEDPEAHSQVAVVHSNATDVDFWYGPYVYLPPGVYQAIFRIRIGQGISGEVLTLRVSSFVSTIWAKVWGNNVTGYHLIFSMNETGTKKEHSSKLVLGEELVGGTYEEFVIDFDVDELGTYEFIGVGIRTPVDIYLDEITVVQVEPNCAYDNDLKFVPG